MEDLHRAGGLLAVLARGAGPARPRRRSPSPDGRWSTTSTTPQVWDDGGHPARAPTRLLADAGIAVLRGTLAPDGAVIKTAAASAAPAAAPRPRPSSSTASRTSTTASTTPTSTSTRTACWSCAAAGPRATRGCPRWRTCRCRKKLLARGVRDMVRVCDGRMSGTAYGTVVLHVAPESAAGGPLGLLADRRPGRPRRGRSSPRRRRARRRSGPLGPPSAAAAEAYAAPTRGWERLYVDHVLQADTGRRPRLPRRRQRRPR